MMRDNRKKLNAIFLKNTLCLFFNFLIITGCTGPQGPAGPPGDPDHLSDPSIQPRVIYTYPPTAATGPFDIFDSGENYNLPHFAVRFNKLMNRLTIEPHMIRCEGFDRPVVVRLYRDFTRFPFPEPGGQQSGDDIYSNVLSFSIYDSLLYYRPMAYGVNRAYTVTIDPGLVDINGNRTQETYVFSFMPEPTFRVVALYPEDSETDVFTTFKPYVVFNSQVDGNIYSSLEFSPFTSGRWEISEYDSSWVSFRRFADLSFGETYGLTVQPTARDIFGNQLPQQVRSTFTTVAFRVWSSLPENGATKIWPSSDVHVSFTGYLDTGTVRPAFDITPIVPGILEISNYGAFQFRPSLGFAPNTVYTVTVGAAVRAQNGTPLGTPYTLSFTTDQFRIIFTEPRDGNYGIQLQSTIYVYSNAKIDTGSVRSAFSISPSTSGRFSIFDGASYFVFIPNLPYQSNTTYTATISTAMRTKLGNNLAAPYFFSFTTRP